MSTRVKAALRRRRAAEDAVVAMLKSDYPPGASIRWEWNARIQAGVVVSNAYGERIKVSNGNTGRELWIYASRIV